MMSVDVPFKSPQEAEETVSHLETLFADRYTEEDPSYRQVVEAGQRWLNVPVMHPWPPRHPRHRGGGGGGRRHGYHDNREYRERRHYDDYRDRRRPHRSPPPRRSPPSHGWSPPPPTHWQPLPHESPHHHPHYPEYSHHQSPPPHPHTLTQPPHSHTHSPPHPHTLTQPPYSHTHSSGSSFFQERNDPTHSLQTPCASTPPPGSPVLQAPPTPSGRISTEESDFNPIETEPEGEKKTALDIETLGNLGSVELKPLPTESDVTDILNLAHGGHTINSLKQVTYSPPGHVVSGKHKRGDKHMKKQKQSHRSTHPYTSSNNTLQISHGQSVSVSPGEVFESSVWRQSHPMVAADRDESSDSDSDVDVIGPPTTSLTVSLRREGLHQSDPSHFSSEIFRVSGFKGDDSITTFQQKDPSSVDRRSALAVLSQDFSGLSSSAVSTGSASEQRGVSHRLSLDYGSVLDDPGETCAAVDPARLVKADKKKKKKKKKKKAKDSNEFVSTVIDSGSGLKLQFKLN